MKFIFKINWHIMSFISTCMYVLEFKKVSLPKCIFISNKSNKDRIKKY